VPTRTRPRAAGTVMWTAAGTVMRTAAGTMMRTAAGTVMRTATWAWSAGDGPR